MSYMIYSAYAERFARRQRRREIVSRILPVAMRIIFVLAAAGFSYGVVRLVDGPQDRPASIRAASPDMQELALFYRSEELR